MKKLLTALILVFILAPTIQAQAIEPIEEGYVKAQVNEVKDQMINGEKIQDVTYEVMAGPHKGIIFSSKNEITGQIYDLDLKKGDRVNLLLKIYEDGTIDGFATDYIRNDIMVVFIVLFMIALILLGKWKGLRALVSLVITVGAIFFVLIPLTLQGYDPLMIALVICAVVTVITITTITGLNKKSLSAITGTVGGILVAALLAFVVSKISMLTGLSGEDARILYINNPELNFFSIFFASIIIGALGAIMDVGVSISSAIHELAEMNPKLSKMELVKSGMNIGKDIMGTMSNTLILAYVGSSLPLLILFSMNQFGAFQVMNFDFMAAEIIRSISGSFGLLLAIPITAFTAGYLRGK